MLLERVLPLAMLVLAIVGAPLMIFSEDGLPRLRTVERELAQVQNENTQVRRRIEVLRARIDKLRDDPAALEQLARDELGLIRQSEVIFQFPK